MLGAENASCATQAPNYRVAIGRLRALLHAVRPRGNSDPLRVERVT